MTHLHIFITDGLHAPTMEWPWAAAPLIGALLVSAAAVFALACCARRRSGVVNRQRSDHDDRDHQHRDAA